MDPIIEPQQSAPEHSHTSATVALIVLVLLVVAVVVFFTLPEEDGVKELSEEEKRAILSELSANANNNISAEEKANMLQELNKNTEASGTSPSEAEKQRILESLR